MQYKTFNLCNIWLKIEDAEVHGIMYRLLLNDCFVYNTVNYIKCVTYIIERPIKCNYHGAQIYNIIMQVLERSTFTTDN